MRERNLIPAEVLREAGTEDSLEIVHLGIAAAKAERFERGLIFLTEAYNRFSAEVAAANANKLVEESGSVAGRKMPTTLLSYLGLCLAMTKGRHREAARFCEMAIRRDSLHVEHYLNLARVWQSGRSRKNMVEAIERGLAVARSPALLALQEEFGARKPPVVPFLSRDNPVNQALGRVRHRLVKAQKHSGKEKPAPRTLRTAASDIIDLDADEDAPPRAPSRARPRPAPPRGPKRGS